MDERNYRKYSQEFKLEALELLQRGDKRAGLIERELGIIPGLLMKWRARYQIVAREGEPVQIGPSDLEAAKAEIRRLQRAGQCRGGARNPKKVLNIFSRKSE